jgi:hypothetical protein
VVAAISCTMVRNVRNGLPRQLMVMNEGSHPVLRGDVGSVSDHRLCLRSSYHSAPMPRKSISIDPTVLDLRVHVAVV